MANQIEQSGSFIFRNGRVLTFNEEVCCRTLSKLPKDFVGAVKAKSLRELLRKLQSDEIVLEVEDGKFVIKGKGGRKARLQMDEEIFMDFGELEKPSEWSQVDENFGDAINVVQGSAGTDTTEFVGTCIHVAPKWIEATDGYQMARYRIKTGVEESVIVKRDALKPVHGLDMTKVAVTSKWLHFRNPAGLIYSCRRYVEEFPDIREHLKVEGFSASLPKGLVQAVDVASIFSKENSDTNLVVVSLRKDRLFLTAVGVSGDYTEPKKISYDGDPIEFTIPPEILSEISQKHNTVTLSKDRLMVQGANWRYVTTLGDVGEVVPETERGAEDDGRDGEG